MPSGTVPIQAILEMTTSRALAVRTMAAWVSNTASNKEHAHSCFLVMWYIFPPWSEAYMSASSHPLLLLVVIPSR